MALLVTRVAEMFLISTNDELFAVFRSGGKSPYGSARQTDRRPTAGVMGFLRECPIRIVTEITVVGCRDATVHF